MTQIIESAKQAIELFGEPLVARRKTKVQIRETNGTEFFESRHGKGTLKAEQGIDYIVMPIDGSDSYPCKIDIFHDTWEEITEEPGTYRKTALCRCILIPEGVSVTLKEKEGDVTLSHPYYIACGDKDEVYSYKPDWIAKNLEFI